MNSSSLQKKLTCALGTAFVLLGATALPSQAETDLVGFSTYGSMMSGMRVTASFLDGTSETLIWGATGKESGGVFSNNWFITQSGDSYNSPWTLSNSGLGITSLVIDAIPGNTLFDTYPLFEGPLQTPGSAEGWAVEIYAGQSPNFFYAYSVPIDISKGDLFGTLSFYWGSGFTGTMKWRADTDSGSRRNPVQPKDPTVINTPPTLSFSLPTIYEGEWASGSMFANDAGEDAITFFLDGGKIATDFNRSGLRSASTNLGFFADNGQRVYTALAKDEDGQESNPVTSILNVLNVAPTLTAFNFSNDVIYESQSVSGWLSATDPGADWINFFVNGNPVGTDWLTSGVRSVSTNLGTFADEGEFTFVGQAEDKDKAWSNPLTKTLKVLNIAPTITQLTQNLTVKTNELFNFAAAAIDPGIYDLLTFKWDLNGDGQFDDFIGSTGQWSFGQQGTYQVGLEVSDGDGGYAYGSFTVETIIDDSIINTDGDADASTDTNTDADSDRPVVDHDKTVPEPSMVLGLLGFAAFAASTVLKRKQPQTAEQHNRN